MLTVFAVGKFAYADNVAMVETTKYLAPETVNMLVQRANSGGAAGFVPNDTIKYIIKYKPVPNGGNTGANGYVTDYIPNGLRVIDAGFVQPDGFGGYYEIPPVPAGDMPNTPLGNGNRFAVSLSPLLPATPVNITAEATAGGMTPGSGTLAQLYSDTGVWYAVGAATAFTGGGNGASRNLWDLDQMNYDVNCKTDGGADGTWGTGSPIAGPQTFYRNEINSLTCLLGPEGPWKRIGVPGSRIGDYSLMGDLQASRELFPGDPLYEDISVPPVASAVTPVTIRWANGLNSVGEVKYVFVTAEIVFLPPGGTIINNSEVWGGDVYYGEGGKDNAWKYNDTLVSIGNNSDLTVLKNPSVESAAPGDVVSFQITVINTGAGTQTSVNIVDYVNASYEVGNLPVVYDPMVTYNMDASGAPVYSAGPPGITPGSESLTWSILSLTAGSSQTYSYSVTALDPQLFNPKVTSASDMVSVTSTQLTTPAVSHASFEIGEFPVLGQTKTVTPSSALPGGTVRYHIQIENTGSGYAGVYRWGVPPINVAYPIDVFGLLMSTTIKDTLPTGFSYAGSPSLTLNGAPVVGSTLSVLGNEVTWTIPHTALAPNEIAPGAVLDVYFDALVSPGLASGIYKNTVTTEVPYNKKPKNQVPKDKDWGKKPLWSIDVAPVTVGAVQMTKVATPAMVTNTPTGTSTSYTITVTNNGAVAVTGVAVTETLPTNFTYQASSTTGTAAVAEPAVAGQDVTWPAFDVPANSTRTITFNADISASALPMAYWNNVSATATNATIPPLIQVTPVVVSAPGLSATKAVDRSDIPWLGAGQVAVVSDTVNYTITLTNSGTGYATVDVSDQLPEGFFFPLAGTEIVTMTVGGIPQVMTRLLGVNSATTYGSWPGAVAALPLVGTRIPSWGTFSIPPKQGVLDTTLTIQFAARIDMVETLPPLTVAVTQPGTYNNTVTVAGNALVPVFIGAPVAISRPVSKSTTTPSVAVSGLIDYRFQVDNHGALPWTAVSVVDYLGSLTTLGLAPSVPSGATFGALNAAYYAIGVSAPVGAPGVDVLWLSTIPVNTAPALNFNNGGAGFTIPAGQSLFVAFTATAPAVVPVPATIHNSIQTLSYTSNAVPYVLSNVWDGVLAANTQEDVILTLTPNVNLLGEAAHEKRPI